MATERNLPSPEKVRASLRASIKEGVAWSVMHGAGERYIHPFAVLGEATFFGLAAISALPAFLGSLVQSFSANMADASGRRRRLVVFGALLQALVWIPACAAVFLPPDRGFLLMMFVFLAFLGLQNFTLPPWGSLMGDLVPPERRGRYFGLRNLILGIGICTSFLAAGWVLEFFKARPASTAFGLSGISLGFFLLFAAAGVSRLVSCWYLSRLVEPPYKPKKEDRFTFLDFLRRSPKGNFGPFVWYTTLLHMGVGFAGPYFSWYALKHLGISPGNFAWIWTVHLVSYFGSQPLWGRLSDRIGNKPLIAMGGIGIAGIPLLWLVSSDLLYLAGIQIYDGVVWAAFNIASANYLYDCATPAKRARCTAYAAIFAGFGGLAGAFAGATIAALLPAPLTVYGHEFAHPFILLLIVSSLMRLIPSFLLLGAFREMRVGPRDWLEAFTREGRSLPILKRWWR